ncbi:hypothetical protein [Calycomorphotria hydatis]|uniref:Uncharacterized protein n=1 Tax=Calycomorphotria hydatis TaxID=2528027 RepID=A0A517T972_9PLAN|nr:hypothetical protein [Calycomorphotria hydatis]QDT64913.1 hypothetical protein V22_21580 [Calycomorphotria hydatis]
MTNIYRLFLLPLLGIITLPMLVSDADGQIVARRYGIRPWYYGGYSPYAYNLGGTGYDPYAQRGMAMSEIIRSQGEYNLNTAQALSEYEDARSKYIDNRVKALQAYQERKRMGQAWRDQEQEKKRAQAANYIDHMEKTSEPDRLGPDEFNPRSGTLDWPIALQTDQFTESRNKIDELMQVRNYTSGADSEILTLASSMLDQLRSMIHSLAPPEYIAARKFLEGLMSEIRNPRS